MIQDLHGLLRSSDCTTSPFRSTAGGHDYRGIDNGYLKGGVAISRVAKIYTGARIGVMYSQVPAEVDPATDFRLCVWDYETFQLRAVTDNLAVQLNALDADTVNFEGGMLVAGDFLEPIALREGEWVICGTATFGDYPIRNINLASEVCKKAMMELPPQLGFRLAPTVEATATTPPVGGYPGGIPGSISADPSGNYPWFDLTP